MANVCRPECNAAMAQAHALERIADIAEAAVERFGPAADALAHLGDAQKKLCAFIVGNRLKLAASVPLVLVGIGAISPNMAELIGKVLTMWGG